MEEKMALTKQEIVDMNTQIREYSRAGRPEMAAHVREHLAKGEQFFGEDYEPQPVEVPGQPPFRGKGSGGEAWREFARTVSDLDEELIVSVTKDDLVRMLYANGLIKRYLAEDIDNDDGDGDSDGGVGEPATEED